jgi:hypothetical protein
LIKRKINNVIYYLTLGGFVSRYTLKKTGLLPNFKRLQQAAKPKKDLLLETQEEPL